MDAKPSLVELVGKSTGALHRALSMVGPSRLAALSEADLLELTVSVEEAGRAVDALRVLLAGEIDERSTNRAADVSLAARCGARNAGELMQRLTLQDGREVRSRIRRARLCRPGVTLHGERLDPPLALLAPAVRAGAVGSDSLDVIGATLVPALDHGTDPDMVRAAQLSLVSAATGVSVDTLDHHWKALEGHGGVRAEVPLCPPASRGDCVLDVQGMYGHVFPASDGEVFTAAQVRTMAQAWALAIDPDGTLPDEVATARARNITLHNLDNGMVGLRGRLLPEVATQLTMLLDAYLNPRTPLPAPSVASPGDIEPTKALDGVHPQALVDLPSGVPAAFVDQRTPGQKRHDALAAILRLAVDAASAPTLGGAAPTRRRPGGRSTWRGLPPGRPLPLHGGASLGSRTSRVCGRSPACPHEPARTDHRYRGTSQGIHRPPTARHRSARWRVRHSWVLRASNLVRNPPRDPVGLWRSHHHRQRGPTVLAPPPHTGDVWMDNHHGRGRAPGQRRPAPVEHHPPPVPAARNGAAIRCDPQPDQQGKPAPAPPMAAAAGPGGAHTALEVLRHSVLARAD